MTGNKA